MTDDINELIPKMSKEEEEKMFKTHTCEKFGDKTDEECYPCSIIDCPHKEPLHYHHDGCPACIDDEPKERCEQCDDGHHLVLGQTCQYCGRSSADIDKSSLNETQRLALLCHERGVENVRLKKLLSQILKGRKELKSKRFVFDSDLLKFVNSNPIEVVSIANEKNSQDGYLDLILFYK